MQISVSPAATKPSTQYLVQNMAIVNYRWVLLLEEMLSLFY